MNYSRWSTESEIKNILKKVDIGSKIEKSGIPMGNSANKILIKDDVTHNLVISAPGSGKTQAVMLPLIRTSIRANDSFLVNDVKGELLDKTSGELRKEGYNVIVLDYANLKIGNHYNFFSLPYYLYKNNNKDASIELLENIGYYLIHDDNDNADIFWEKTATDYFVGLALYLFENAKESEINLNSLVSLSNDIFNAKKDYSKIIMDSLNKYSSAYQFLSGTLFAPSETSGGIIATFSQRVKKFVSREMLSNMMASSDFDILNVNKGKTAIFIISGNSEEANVLMSILFDQVFYGINNLDNRDNIFNFIIDEFDSMKAIKDFYSKINYARGINIRVTAFVKSLSNLDNIYGNKNKDLIRLCFDNIIYLFANDIYTLEEISKLCGNTSKGPLISVEELKVIKRFEEIVLMPRMYPIRTKVIPDYELDWNFDNSKIKFNNLETIDFDFFDIDNLG